MTSFLPVRSSELSSFTCAHAYASTSIKHTHACIGGEDYIYNNIIYTHIRAGLPGLPACLYTQQMVYPAIYGGLTPNLIALYNVRMICSTVQTITRRITQRARDRFQTV